MLTQQIANGIATGLAYAVLASGLSLTFSATRIVNFAHGDLFVLGAFLCLSLQREFDVPYFPAAAISVACIVALSALIGLGVVDRIKGTLAQSIATIALGLGLRDGVLIVFGSDSASFPPLYPDGVFQFAAARIPWSSAFVAVILTVIVLAFTAFMRHSRWGLWMRAAAINNRLAESVGISVRQTRVLAFAVSGGLAAVAAVVVGPVWQVSYGLGPLVAVKAFAAAIIGGFGDLRGAFVGGLVLGLLESLFAGYVSSQWRDAAVYGLLMGILILSPRGIFQTFIRRIA
jgi:branched-chain amino acid transport system permease protein